VLRTEPDWRLLPTGLSPAARAALKQCLHKDPTQRIHHIADMRLALDGAFDAPGDGAPTDPAGRRTRVWKWAIASAATASLLTAALAWMLLVGSRSAETPWQHFTQVTDLPGVETAPSISPNGDLVAYATREGGTWDIYAQRVGGGNRSEIAVDPDRDESGPAYSPDGEWIAHHEGDRDGGIFVVGATGESPQRLTEFGFHPAWSPDGLQIAFSTELIERPELLERTSTYTLSIGRAANCDCSRITPLSQPGRRRARASSSGR
jgi:hypothetical protein